jgi:succinate dehydrogenase / fumarate reductase, iron-sulfur subunit
MAAKREQITLKILRQDGPESPTYWDSFVIPEEPQANVISALQTIQRNPVNASGKTVNPVVWDSQCLEEVCGACSMRINGQPRQACTALLSDMPDTVTLEPLTKFPVIRDLMVDRARMFRALEQVHGWNETDGYHNLGLGEKISQTQQADDYAVSRCMTCGCCWEVCPQVNDGSEFFGPSTVAQAVLHNNHPIGVNDQNARLDELGGVNGVNNCGNAQNCERYCPKEVPLLSKIAEAGRQVTLHAVRQVFQNR